MDDTRLQKFSSYEGHEDRPIKSSGEYKIEEEYEEIQEVMGTLKRVATGYEAEEIKSSDAPLTPVSERGASSEVSDSMDTMDWKEKRKL